MDTNCYDGEYVKSVCGTFHLLYEETQHNLKFNLSPESDTIIYDEVEIFLSNLKKDHG